jgi:2-polyprenyl-3-methyl-5-hydroxy-6-metoxy-1,4-benzoquinol methylase
MKRPVPDFNYGKWRGMRPYGKHSFYNYDPKFVKNVFHFDLPEGYGLKVFANDNWQGTDFIEAAQIQNIFWIEGLAPRVIETGLITNGRNLGYHIIEHLTGKAKSDPQKLRAVAEKYHIQMYKHANGQKECEINSANWVDGKYLDFGGWHMDLRWYEDFIKQEVVKTHYGKNIDGSQFSYQSDNLFGGKRQTSYRIDFMRLNEIDFKQKSVVDIGCNLGMFLHYAWDKEATRMTGYDVEKNINVAKQYANYKKKFNIDFIACDLKTIIPDKADIVFYLSMSEYLGFPEWLKDITGEVLIYEGHASTTKESDEANLSKLFKNVEFIGISTDRSERPVFRCRN